MALATARIEWETRDAGAFESIRVPITNGTQLYDGQFVQFDSGGRVKPYAADAAGTDGGLVLGMVAPTRRDNELATYLLGNTSLSPVPEAIVSIGSFVLSNVAVTGASAQTNVGALVYLDAANTAGDRTLTLTSTSNGTAVGEVVAWRTSTRCDVRVFSYAERRALST